MRGRRRGAYLIGVLVVALIAGAVGVGVLQPRLRAAGATPPEAGAEPVTATVERASLVSRVRLSAQLGYGEPIPLPTTTGMLTALPRSGRVVTIGEPVHEVDGAPVVLLRGKRPFWRDLSVDSALGADVRQLEANLKRLGFFAGEPDGRYDWVTRQAVRDWQASLDLPRTGAFSASSVVVADAPGIRIAQVGARLGESAVSPGTYTETTVRASAKLTAALARELDTGTPVSVVLPDGTQLETTVAAVDPGGVPTGDGDAVTPPQAIVEFEDQDPVAEIAPAAVRIVIGDDSDQPETLVVPVTALLALPQDRYAVEILDGASTAVVPVEIGLVADARVQVLRSGAELDGDSADGGGPGRILVEGDQVVLAR